jgi:hypothetical protein
MAGELTTGTISVVDINEPVAIAAAIDAITLTAVTDMLFVVPNTNQQRVHIFKVTRAA